MKRLSTVLLLVSLLLLVGCESRTDQVDGGGVLLSISDFDGLPIEVGVNLAALAGLVSIGEITVESIVKDPNGSSSALMSVEMDSYEVSFSRSDGGVALPPPLVRNIFGVVQAGGNIKYENLPILSLDQLQNPPLADLLIENGAYDKETGRGLITLNLSLRFFGYTLSGDEVDSAPALFTVQFVP